jgi:Protein of unknown function (DUF2752).
MQKATCWSKNNKLYLKIKIAGILAIPAFLFIVPLQWLEKQHSVCIFKLITGKECYGCGMTRAVLSALHFNFNNAYNYNKLIVIVLPLLIFIWVDLLLKTRTSFKACK